MAMWLIHFKSRDVERLRTQGQFWHIFFTTGNVIIAQDEKDTWTIHIPIDVGASVDGLDPKEAIYKALGSEGAPFPITIDEILVTSVWRPTICLAEQYSKGSVFIAGDAAHQNIPTGGYGMNTAVGDSFDIGWKLSAVLKGYAGPHLLESYEQERRPVGAQNIERSGVHHSVHTTYVQWCTETPGLVLSSESAGKALRDRIRQHVQANDGENQDHGIEMGYRYNTSSVIAFMDGDRDDEPHWNEREFIPSSWPGSRAPHVFLRDGQRSIFDWFGTGAEFTLVDFTADSRYIELFRPVLLLRGVPCKFVHLPDEEHAHRVWERDALLVRPDDHIAWRAPRSDDSLTEAVVNEVVDIVTGVRPRPETTQHKDVAEGLKTPFTGTIGNVSLSDIKDRATFQT
jgi:FAD-dependent monooxygenase